MVPLKFVDVPTGTTQIWFLSSFCSIAQKMRPSLGSPDFNLKNEVCGFYVNQYEWKAWKAWNAILTSRRSACWIVLPNPWTMPQRPVRIRHLWVRVCVRNKPCRRGISLVHSSSWNPTSSCTYLRYDQNTKPFLVSGNTKAYQDPRLTRNRDPLPSVTVSERSSHVTSSFSK